MPTRSKVKTPSPQPVKPEKQKWPRDMGSKFGASSSHHKHMPLGMGKHRKSFGHV